MFCLEAPPRRLLAPLTLLPQEAANPSLGPAENFSKPTTHQSQKGQCFPTVGPTDFKLFEDNLLLFLLFFLMLEDDLVTNKPCES